jgi:hypothetical protein
MRWHSLYLLLALLLWWLSNKSYKMTSADTLSFTESYLMICADWILIQHIICFTLLFYYVLQCSNQSQLSNVYSESVPWSHATFTNNLWLRCTCGIMWLTTLSHLMIRTLTQKQVKSYVSVTIISHVAVWSRGPWWCGLLGWMIQSNLLWIVGDLSTMGWGYIGGGIISHFQWVFEVGFWCHVEMRMITVRENVWYRC